jgi:putative ABC transport system permease protein
MKSVISLCRGLLKKQIKSNIMIAVIFIICFSCIATAIITVNATGSMLNTVIEQQKSMHELAHFTSDEYPDFLELERWFQEHELVESAQLSAASSLQDRIKIGENNMGGMFQEMREDSVMDFVTVLEGKITEYPDPQTVWIATGFAKRYALGPGDEILIPNGADILEYTISAVVLDPLYSSTLINPSRIWVRPGELAMMKSFSSLDNLILTIRYFNPEENIQVWNDFSDWSGAGFTGRLLAYQDYHLATSMATTMMVTAVFVIGILLLIICLIVLIFMVTGDISNQYKNLGVLKALGFASNQIMSATILQYLLLLMAGIPLVFFLSKISTHAIIKQYATSLGIRDISLSVIPSMLVALLIVAVFIILSVTFATVRVKKIKPAIAIRYGSNVTKSHGKSFFTLKNTFTFNSALFINLKQSAGNVGKLLFSAVILFVLTFTMFFGIGFRDTFQTFFSKTTPLGFPDCDLIVICNNEGFFGYNSDDVYSYLSRQSDYQNLIRGYVPRDSISIVLENQDDYRVTSYCVLGDYDEYGLYSLEGRNPVGINEIAITQITGEQTGKGIGDIIDLSINGRVIPFTVTGTYQGTNDMGKGVRLPFEAFQQFDPTIKPNWFFIDYPEGFNINAAEKKFESVMGGYIEIQNPKEFLASLSQPIIQSTSAMMLALVVICAIVCVITLFNFTISHIYKERQNYGILIAGGMAPGQIIGQQILNIVTVATIAIVAALIVVLSFMAPLLSQLFKSTGISDVTLIIDPMQMIFASLLTYGVGISAVFLATGKLKNINLRELVVE